MQAKYRRAVSNPLPRGITIRFKNGEQPRESDRRRERT